MADRVAERPVEVVVLGEPDLELGVLVRIAQRDGCLPDGIPGEYAPEEAFRRAAPPFLGVNYLSRPLPICIRRRDFYADFLFLDCVLRVLPELRREIARELSPVEHERNVRIRLKPDLIQLENV